MLTVLAVVAASGAKGSDGMPQFNPDFFAPQLIWLALTFAALYFLMSRIALPRIGEVIEERRDRVQRDLDEAERLKAETEKALTAYEQALSDARGKAQGIAKATRDKLAGEVEAERTRVDGQVAQSIAEAEKRIFETKSRAISQVNEIAADTAGAIVARLVGNEPTRDEIKSALTPPAAR